MNLNKIELSDLNNPPAGEAIIEIRLRAEDEPMDLASLEPLVESFSRQYPIKKEAYDEIDISLAGDFSSRRALKIAQTGWNLSSNDGDCYQSVWIHTNKLLVSNVGKYCGGDSLIELFENSWKVYKPSVTSSFADRLSMRYINKLILTPEEVATKLKVRPSLPHTGLIITEWLSQACVVNSKDRECQANINHYFKALSTDENDPFIEVIIDIDAYALDLNLQVSGIIKQKLDALRVFKNELFIGSVSNEGLKDFL